MAENAPAGTLGQPFKIQTNAFGVKLKKEMHFWRYDLMIYAEILSGKKTVFFTKKGREDYTVMNRNFKCKLIFDAVVRINKDFFEEPSMLWYDGQSILYSGMDLFRNRDKSAMKFHISGRDCRHECLKGFETITFDIAPVKEDYCVSFIPVFDL
ncbi:unnamed protein product [Heligmosomoides polygyrus]|uniref:DUF1968 domain-containing protein n=1 Tax=Heligmosomoides polygyrus TaxID=6339 RepID=A0A183GQV0_HELPZ|nr:unnamed protein product [Heligmosomoides polygyrus]